MKRDYLSHLARAARWYLPAAEAAEVLEDYQEIVEAEPRTEEELRRHIGTPKDAVGQLVQLRAYHRWLAVFAVLAVCVLLPTVSPICSRLFWWNGVYQVNQLNWTFLLVGTPLSFLWFQRKGKKEGRLPGGIPAALLVPLAGMAWSWFLGISALYWLGPLTRFTYAHPGAAPAFHWSLLLGGLAMGLTGLFGLVRARLGDRRWRAVYILGLTGALTSLFVWSMLSSMNLDFSATDWQTPQMLRLSFITLAGLLGTAVSLC